MGGLTEGGVRLKAERPFRRRDKVLAESHDWKKVGRDNGNGTSSFSN